MSRCRKASYGGSTYSGSPMMMSSGALCSFLCLGVGTHPRGSRYSGWPIMESR